MVKAQMIVRVDIDTKIKIEEIKKILELELKTEVPHWMVIKLGMEQISMEDLLHNGVSEELFKNLKRLNY